MRKYEYLEPTAKKAIDRAKVKGEVILMMVDGFQTEVEALILKDLLWYARDNGVEVLMVPKSRKKIIIN